MPIFNHTSGTECKLINGGGWQGAMGDPVRPRLLHRQGPPLARFLQSKLVKEERDTVRVQAEEVLLPVPES